MGDEFYSLHMILTRLLDGMMMTISTNKEIKEIQAGLSNEDNQ